MGSASLGLGLSLALLATAPIGAAGDPAPLRIGRITILTQNVFSEEEARTGKLYRALDRARVKTRPSVIRKFLLFHEGEPYDEEKLRETEKNLRELGFLKAARVTAKEPKDGLVDVDVVTQDSWTLVPGVPLASAGGTTTYGLQLLERDLLGTGRELSLSYNKEIERVTRVVAFVDPTLFGPYWAGRISFGHNSDGNRARASVTHPFTTLTALRSHEAEVDVFGQVTRTYADGDVATAFHQSHREVLLEVGAALAASAERAHRLTAGIEIREDRFERLADRPLDPIPFDRTFRTFFVSYELAQRDLLQLNFVNRDLKVDDFDLGLDLSAKLGFSPSLFGAPANTSFVRLALRKGSRLGKGRFVLGEVSYETRLRSGVENEIVSGSLLFVSKLRTKRPQTFVAKARFDQGWNLDRDVQFIADGLAGLRGYRLFSFAGTKRVILNGELRVFKGKELLRLFSPGLALFVDTGTASPANVPIRLSGFKTDVGLGLRMAVNRAPTDNIYRIDLAYALDRDPKGKRGLLISFSASQGF